MFKKTKSITSADLIAQANDVTSNAVSIFNKTVDDLQHANDVLHSVIQAETNVIEDSKSHIKNASTRITTNKHIIGKLQDFLNPQTA